MTDDRARLLRGTARLEDGSRRLVDAQRIAEETTEQGNEILRDLRRQREQIENSRDTVSSSDRLAKGIHDELFPTAADGRLSNHPCFFYAEGYDTKVC